MKFRVYLRVIVVTHPELFSGFGLVAKEVSLMMVEIKRLLIVALTTLACVSMWGCGDLKKDGPVEWDEERTVGKVIGFIDDSLVIVSDWRGWNQEKGTFIHDGGMSGGLGHQGLRVYNYRVQEDGPRWIDSLSNEIDDDFGYSKGQLSDSVVWGGDNVHTYSFEKTISFWRLGEKPRKMDVETRYDGCTIKVSTRRFREWKDGKIIALGEYNMDYYKKTDQCQYAILDTVERAITYKVLDDELKWIEKCDDVRAWGTDVYCFMPGESAFEAVLLRNGLDTIDVPIKFTVGDFYGNVLRLNANLCDFFDGKVACSGTIWHGGLVFYKDEEIVAELE